MDIRLPLPAALRHRVQGEEKLWAHAVSLLLSPPVVWALWVYATAYLRGVSHTFEFASLFALSICVAPMLFVAYKVRNGKISDMHMRESNERYIPYSIAIVGGILTGLVYLRYDAGPVLLLVVLVSIVELTIMLAATFYMKVSLHAMALSSVIAATTLLFGFAQGLLFMPLLLLVVLARLVLRRHTTLQIMAGVLIGVLTPLLVVAAAGLML